MHQAMRGLIRDVLSKVRDGGLPGEHHFFITFDTKYEGVTLSDWLRSRYPDEMTIVLQHWFDNLDVTDDGFGVTLNFGDQPERLEIPFDALRTFVDPSVEFGLRFESHDSDDDDDDDLDDDHEDAPVADLSAARAEGAAKPAKASAKSKAGKNGASKNGASKDGTGKNGTGGDAEVVSLDSFRKP